MRKSAGKAAVTGLVMLGIAIVLQLLTENAKPTTQGGAIFLSLLVGIPGLLFIIFEVVAVIRAIRNRVAKK